jgi:hypothetical protein
VKKEKKFTSQATPCQYHLAESIESNLPSHPVAIVAPIHAHGCLQEKPTKFELENYTPLQKQDHFGNLEGEDSHYYDLPNHFNPRIIDTINGYSMTATNVNLENRTVEHLPSDCLDWDTSFQLPCSIQGQSWDTDFVMDEYSSYLSHGDVRTCSPMFIESGSLEIDVIDQRVSLAQGDKEGQNSFFDESTPSKHDGQTALDTKHFWRPFRLS